MKKILPPSFWLKGLQSLDNEQLQIVHHSCSTMNDAAPASLTSLLENATCGELQVSLMALSEDARKKLRTTLEHVDLQTRMETEMAGTLPASSAQVTYRVAFVDGSEMDVSLQEDASIQDAILAIAEKKGTNAGRLKLLVSGQTDLLPPSREKKSLMEAAKKQTDLMVVFKNYVQLGKVVGTLTSKEVNFEHFASSAFLEGGSAEEVELCEGSQVCWPGASLPGYTTGIFSEALPLSGKVLMRILVVGRTCAMGMGLGTEDMDMNKDAEHNAGFYGLYHGGHSINVCAQRQRTFVGGGSSAAWTFGKRLAILLDIDECTMQCFDELSPLGESQSLPKKSLWPAVVLHGYGDCVSISVSHL